MAKRIVKVDPDFYIKLISYLKSDERYMSERGGIILIAPTAYNKLIEFSPTGDSGEEEENGKDLC